MIGSCTSVRFYLLFFYFWLFPRAREIKLTFSFFRFFGSILHSTIFELALQPRTTGVRPKVVKHGPLNWLSELNIHCFSVFGDLIDIGRAKQTLHYTLKKVASSSSMLTCVWISYLSLLSQERTVNNNNKYFPVKTFTIKPVPNTTL